MEMSLREIQIALNYIGSRTHNNFALEASLHGIKIPKRSIVPKKPEGFTDDEINAADDYMKQRVLRRVK